MNDKYQRIAALCRNPTKIEDIQAHVGVTKRTIYNLVARGMLKNLGSKAMGLYVVNDGVSVEKEKDFKPMRAIEQVSSVWEYAARCRREAQHA